MYVTEELDEEAYPPQLERHGTVCRHTDGSWNGVCSQFGEQTYIRYGKGKGM